MRVLALMAAVSTIAAAQSVCPAREVWPDGDWAEALVAPNAATAALDAYAFPPGRDEASGHGVRTDGLLLIQGGRIIYERYGRGFARTNRHPARSVSKSFSSALIGVAVREGLVALDDSVCTHLPEFTGRPQCAIRVIDTVTHGSGLAWQEVGFDGVESSLWAMLHGEGHRALVAFVMGHAMVPTPATRWSYNTGTASLAAAIAQRALEKKYGRDALWKALFEPIGAPGLTLEFDLAGAPIGGSAVYATPRDFARLGYLFLNDGCWRGARLLPEQWVAFSTTTSDVYAHSDVEPDKHGMPNGYLWWVNEPLPPPFAPGLPLPDVPRGSYAAIGTWNQLLFVVPTLDLVVVRTADDHDSSFNLNDFMKLVQAVAR